MVTWRTITQTGGGLRHEGVAFRRRVGGAAAVAAAAMGLMALHPPPASALMLTNGSGYGPPYGGAVCADVTANDLTPGTKVQAWQCLGGPNQQFELYGLTTYALGGQRCLTAAATNPGSAVVSAVCNGSVEQQWFYVGGQIYGFDTAICLDAHNGTNGSPLTIEYCNGRNSQFWQLKAVLLTNGTGLGPPYGRPVCADVTANSLTPGTKVQAWQCLGGPNQLFEFYGSTIYTEGGQRCLSAAGTTVGSGVVSASCNGSPEQQWYYDTGVIGSQGVISNGPSTCLDAGVGANGTQLTVQACSGADSQFWIMK
jgi:hypothetical protein